MLIKSAKREARRILLVEFNPYQILVAAITYPPGGQMAIEAAAEFDRDDFPGLNSWLDDDPDRVRGRLVICSLVPVRGIVQRETVQPAQLTQTSYLEELVEQQQRGRFLTATPFKVVKEGTWTFRTLNATDGSPLPITGPAQPALICAVANSDVLDIQQRLLEYGVLRDRVEPGLLSLFGAVYSNIHRRGDVRAVAVVLVLEAVTAVYILGKEGVHTPNPVLQGMNSIVELGRKEFGAETDEEVLAQLYSAAPATARQAGKLVRRIGRDLKPVIDSFEMTTGQPVEEMLCAYLPSKLSWLMEPLAQSTGRQPFTIELAQAFPALPPTATSALPTSGQHWLGALEAVTNLSDSLGRKSKRGSKGTIAYAKPWHVDCSVPIRLNQAEAAGRRFVLRLAAILVTIVVLSTTVWQIYALDSVRTDTEYWEKQLTANRRLFQELTEANAVLKQQTAIFDRAHELMAEPFQLSDFLVNLGRTVPPRMRVDRIDSNDARITVSGSLLEPAEEASGTLGRYMEVLRRDANIGPLFANIAITSLQRKTNSDEVMFELTLRLNRFTP